MNFIKRMKHNAIIKLIGKNIYGFIKRTFMIFCNKIYGVNNESVVFVSFRGESYSDNPKAISEKLHETNPDINIIWLFIEPSSKKGIVPDYITCLKANSFKGLKALATSKFWVDNFNKPPYIYKSKQQVYIQTWHGDRGFKKVLYDAWPERNRPYPVVESNLCDLAISGSDYGDKVYRSAFDYKGEIMKYGSPRADQLINFDSQKASQIKKKLHIDNNSKLFLYAPTFRDSERYKCQDINIDLDRVLLTLEKKYGGNWVCLLRAHSGSRGFRSFNMESSKYIDVSKYEDMADLLLITDFLITDYSSTVGDYILLNKPYIMYHADKSEYIEKNRDFYFDFEKSPYYIAYSNDELIEKIMQLDDKIVIENAQNLLEFYKTNETGKASEMVAKYIINKTKAV